MQLYQLNYFIAVAETLSFTGGAKRVHIVQSAVSAAIAQLEAELKVRLFDRGHHSITLTPAGHDLLPRARDVLTSVQLVAETAAAARGEIAGDVALGTMAYVGPLDLAGVLERLQHDHPGVTVRLRQTASGSRTSLEEIRAGTLDLALVATTHGTHAVEIETMHTEPLAFVCPRGHPLAGRTGVDLVDLVEEPFIEYPLGWGNRSLADQAFAREGLSRTIRTEVSDFSLAIALVERNLGVTLLPTSAVPDQRHVAKIPITDAPLWQVGIARSTHRPLSAATRALITYLREAGTH